MDEAIHEIENLFRKTGTVDAGEYRGLAGLVEERRELQGRLESLEEGQPDLVAAGSRPLIAEMERSTPDELAAEQQRLDGEAERLEEEIRLSREALWELQRRRKELEDANATDDVQQEIHRLSDSLRGDAGRWAVLTIARTLLERTKEEFQRERQPQLLTMASNYFARITDQRYAQVRTVVGEDRFEVVERTTRVKQVSELSRGTSEQLYLALRFAFIEDYARNAEPMPVIIDDGMVNFDPVRAQAACAATVELAKRFQVFILTCQPYTVDYFKDCTDDLNVVEL